MQIYIFTWFYTCYLLCILYNSISIFIQNYISSCSSFLWLFSSFFFLKSVSAFKTSLPSIPFGGSHLFLSFFFLYIFWVWEPCLVVLRDYSYSVLRDHLCEAWEPYCFTVILASSGHFGDWGYGRNFWKHISVSHRLCWVGVKYIFSKVFFGVSILLQPLNKIDTSEVTSQHSGWDSKIWWVQK